MPAYSYLQPVKHPTIFMTDQTTVVGKPQCCNTATTSGAFAKLGRVVLTSRLRFPVCPLRLTFVRAGRDRLVSSRSVVMKSFISLRC